MFCKLVMLRQNMTECQWTMARSKIGNAIAQAWYKMKKGLNLQGATSHCQP